LIVNGIQSETIKEKWQGILYMLNDGYLCIGMIWITLNEHIEVYLIRYWIQSMLALLGKFKNLFQVYGLFKLVYFINTENYNLGMTWFGVSLSVTPYITQDFIGIQINLIISILIELIGLWINGSLIQQQQILLIWHGKVKLLDSSGT